MFFYISFEEELYTEELGTYRSYGIRVENEIGETLLEISDVSTDARMVADLATRCTLGKVDPLHLRDVVSDYIEAAALPFR